MCKILACNGKQAYLYPGNSRNARQNSGVAVQGGGCSGFSYIFSIDDTQTDADLIFTRDGVDVLVDDMSLQYMDGAEIDWVDDLIGASFRINNPNATASCGCGTSFDI